MGLGLCFEGRSSDGSNVYFDAVSAGDIAVFSIADLSLFQNKSVQFAAPTNYSLVVINVLSTNSLTTPGGMNFNGPTGLGTKVIWTFAGLTAGAWFGEGTVLKKEPRRYDVVALRDTRLAMMDRKPRHTLAPDGLRGSDAGGQQPEQGNACNDECDT
mgnify:CR=1 FL=1